MGIWANERTEIATWLSGYLSMVKTWVDKILDNEHYDVDKNKIIGLIDEWIQWLEETKLKIMKMKDVEPTLGLQNSRPEGDGTEYVFRDLPIQYNGVVSIVIFDGSSEIKLEDDFDYNSVLLFREDPII